MGQATDLESSTSNNPLSFDEVFVEERLSISRRRYPNNKKTKNDLSEPYNLTSLCLSGGGVRSASFCLGVVRALAEVGYFKRFDYLSTVSGGGFIGAFLSRWAKEVGCDEVEAKLKNDKSFSEKTPLNHLRRYIAYLTPRMGVSSLDSLAAAILFVRNLFINWLVIMPWIFALCFLPHFFDRLLRYLESNGTPLLQGHNKLAPILLVSLGISFLVSAYRWSLASKPPFVGKQLSADQQDPIFLKPFVRFRVPIFIVMLCLMAIAGNGDLLEVLSKSVTSGNSEFCPESVLPSSNTSNPHISEKILCHIASSHLGPLMSAIGILGFIYHLYVQVRHQFDATTGESFWKQKIDLTLSYKVFKSFLALLCQVAAGVIALWIGGLIVGKFRPDFGLQAGIILLPLILQMSYLVSDAIYNAFRSGEAWADIEQEWTGRLNGALFSLPFLWGILAAVSLWGPDNIAIKPGDASWTPLLNFGGATGLTGVMGLLLANVSAAYEKTKKGIDAWQAIGLRWGLWLVLGLFAALILLLFSILGSSLTNLIVPLPDKTSLSASRILLDASLDVESSYYLKQFLAVGIIIVVPLAVSAFIDGCSNLNKFSLHGIYRNRLVRAFLGAANPQREGHAPGFLNMLWRDNIPISYLDNITNPIKVGLIEPPLHLVNMAMNIPGSSNEALQERKALPFTSTPLHTGSSALIGRDSFEMPISGQYRKSTLYASDARLGSRGQPFSLGGAVAISGAAFDPSMGRFGSAAMRMLLTLANVRLGVWLGNPGVAGNNVYKRKGPVSMIRQIAMEFLGLADEKQKYVHLSDGGHFENLAAYEMLRRKCCFIVIVDAGCDPDYMFEDLGNLQRMARVDLNAKIDFLSDDLAKFKSGDLAFTIGEVTYRNDINVVIGTGVVCYIKPAMLKDLQPEIDAYHRGKMQFPHETTLNQFFTESQFLAYMTLGQKQGQALVAELRKNPPLQISGW